MPLLKNMTNTLPSIFHQFYSHFTFFHQIHTQQNLFTFPRIIILFRIKLFHRSDNYPRKLTRAQFFSLFTYSRNNLARRPYRK